MKNGDIAESKPEKKWEFLFFIKLQKEDMADFFLRSLIQT